MTKLYKNIGHFLKLSIMTSCVILLTSCSVSFPTGVWNDTTVVTRNPDKIPDISWQTPHQREELAKQKVTVTPMPSPEPAPAEQKIEEQTSAMPQTQLETSNSIDHVEEVAQYSQPVYKENFALRPSRKITVSILLPLSGNKANLGNSMLNAAQMALFDVGSTNFELVPIDTQGTKKGAISAAKQAVSSNTDLILGPIFSENLKAIKPIVKPSNTPVISFTTDWTLGDSNTYIMGFLPFTQVARVARYAQKRGHTQFAVYAPKTDYCDIVIRTLRNTGAPIVRIGRYSPNQPDISELVKDFIDANSKVYRTDYKKETSEEKRIREEQELAKKEAGIVEEEPEEELTKVIDFDTLVLPVGSEGLKAIINELEVNEVDQTKVRYIGTGLWDDEKLTKNPSLYGAWFAAPDPALREDFESRFKENFGEMPLRIASLAYDATALAAVLARTSDNYSSPYKHETLTNPRGFAGIDGIFRFRNDGLNERGLAVLEIQAGKAKVVDTAPTAFILSSNR